MADPLVQRLEQTIPAQATAATVQDYLVGEAAADSTVTSVSFTPEAAITGAATDNRKYALVNKGAAGAGTTEIASLTMDSGVNAVAFDEKALTLSGTAANLNVAAGDQLLFVETVNGTGLASPGGRVQVELKRR